MILLPTIAYERAGYRTDYRPISVSRSGTRGWIESRSWSGVRHSSSNRSHSKSSTEVGLTDEEFVIKKILDE